jgi:PAS domain S-box-containing protein
MDALNTRFLDTYLKIKINHIQAELQIQILDYNESAKTCLHIHTPDQFSLLDALKQTICPDFPWSETLIEVAKNPADYQFDVQSTTKKQAFRCSIIHKVEDIFSLQIQLNSQSQEDESKQRRLNFSDLFETLPLFVLITDKNGKIIHVNKQFIDIIGIKKEKIINTSIKNFIPRESISIWDNKIQQVYKSGIQQCKLPFINHLGNRVDVETNILIGQWENSEVLFIVSNDISNQTLSEGKFASAFHTNASLMAITTPDGFLIDINQSFLDLTGYQKEELMHRGIREMKLLDKEDLLPQIRENLFKIGYVKDLEVHLRARNGKRIHCILSIHLINSRDTSYLLVVLDNKSEQHILNQRLDFAMKTGNLAWYEFDMIHGIVNASPNKAEILGYQHTDFENAHYSKWTELLHPDDYAHTMDNMKKCILGESNIYQVDYRIKRADGNYTWFYDRGVVVEYTPDGKPSHISGVVIDISDRKQVEEKIRENEEKYRKLIENANDVILITQNNRIVFANQKIKTILQYHPEKILGKNLSMLFNTNTFAKVNTYLSRQTSQENNSTIFETTVLDKHGNKIPIELNSSLYIYNNQPASLIFVRDLRQRKETEKKLRQSLKDFQLATENIHSIVWKVELIDNTISNIFISKVADKILEYEHDSINNDFYKFLAHVHPDDKDFVWEKIQELVYHPGQSREFSSRVVTKKGNIVYLLTQGKTEIDEDGRIIGFAVSMDVSQIRLAEFELNSQKTFLHRLIDTIPAMIGVKDQEGKYIMVNKQYAGFYDLQPENILGKTDYEILEKSLANSLTSNDKQILKNGIPAFYNITQAYKGTTKYFEIAKVPIKDQYGIISQLLIVSNDITDKILAKQEIEEQSKQLLSLTENIDLQLWHLTDPYTYGVINKAHAEFLGKQKHEIENKSINSLFKPNIAKAYIGTNEECFYTKQIIQFDEWNNNQQGEPRLLRINKNPMINQNGDVQYVVCVARDITEEFRAEQELKVTLNFNKTLIETSPIGILVYHTSGQCILANKAAVSIIGAKTVDDLLAQNAVQNKTWERHGLIDSFKKATKTKETIHIVRKIDSSFGKNVWIECNFKQIDYKNDTHVMLIIDDVTEIKNQEINIKKNLERQKVLSSVAFQLSSLENFNKNLSKSLEIIGKFMNVSRVYIFRNIEDNTACQNVFEWCNTDIHAEINNLQNVPYSAIESWKDALINDKFIKSSDTNKLPKDLQDILLPQGIKSIIAFPLNIFKEFSGFIGFDENLTYRNWTDDDFEFLQTISHMIANTYERKIIGDNLKEREEMFAKISSGAMDGIILINNEGYVTYWNEAASDIFGYSSKEIIGKDLHEILTEPEDTKKFLRNKVKFAKTGKGNAINKNTVLKAITKYGKVIEIELSLSSLKIKNEWHAVGIVRDITERKKVEDQLQTLSKAVENASATIVITDPNGSIEYVNRKFTETTGYSKEEALGNNPRILSSGKHPVSFYKTLWETIIQGKEWKGEFHNKRKNGETYYESALISSIQDNNGNILHYIGIKEDITREKIAQEELVKAKQNAEMANKAKSEFLANMSHEIRTPMNAIIGFSEILAKKITDQEYCNYLESIQASSKTLLNLINDILDLSKIEAGQMRIQNEPVNIKALIEDLLQIFSLKTKQKSLATEIKIDPNLPEYVYIDELRLRQIILNLIGNAVKFTEEGFIKVILEITQFHQNESIDLKLSIKDSGIGIKKEFHETIFEAFRQQEDHRTRNYGGTGLGLSITKRLVEIQGGEISLESTYDVGSTFIVRFFNLKFIKQSAQKETQKEDSNKEYVFNNETILIVDDVPSNRFLLNSYLSEYGFNLIEAENGADAVELCNSFNPDIVLMDLRMPVMNGIDATKSIKTNDKTSKIPVIAVTASSLNYESNEIESCGFDGFLDKPVSQSEILQQLNKFLKPKTIKIKEQDTQDSILWNFSKQEISIIKSELSPKLQEVESSRNFSEYLRFAENMKEIAKTHKINDLTQLAEKLSFAADSFDIEKAHQIFDFLNDLCNKAD